MTKKKIKISLIVARTLNNVIGKENKMPWHLPKDLAWFRQQTLSKPVVMGRKTYESIGRLLPNRQNIILSRTGFQVDGAYSAQDLRQAIEIAQNFTNSDEVMIIGGGELYKQAVSIADRLYLTEIQVKLDGDTFFEFDLSQWKLQTEHYEEADEQNEYACRFMIWEKI